MSNMDDDAIARLTLISLPQLGPARAQWLTEHSNPAEVVTSLHDGRLPATIGTAPRGVTKQMVTLWTEAIRSSNVEHLIRQTEEAGVELLTPDDDRWPFADEPDPPLLVFCLGDLDLLRAWPKVAVVGTRRCTSIGRTVAHDMGTGLAAEGVCVVSGLALGIDGAAHRGCLDGGGRPIGIVGTGLDVVYPGANRSLWSEVAASGLLVSEAPVGTRPERWRFPARNRLIASLCHAAVVVESHERGGSLLTADECLDRDRPLYAVPGSVTSAASDGTNSLLVDGATPARNANDILDGLSLAGSAEKAAYVDGGNPASSSISVTVEHSQSELPAAIDNSVAELIWTETSAGSVTIDVLALDVALSSHGDNRVSAVIAEVQRLCELGAVATDGATVFRVPIKPSDRGNS